MRVEYIFTVNPQTGEVSLLDDHDGEQVGLYNAKSDTVAFAPDHLQAADFRRMALVVWEKSLDDDLSPERVLH